MQNILVAIILVACVAYTVRRLWLRFTAPPADAPHCEGCPLAESCKHKSLNRQVTTDATTKAGDSGRCCQGSCCQ